MGEENQSDPEFARSTEGEEGYALDVVSRLFNFWITFRGDQQIRSAKTALPTRDSQLVSLILSGVSLSVTDCRFINSIVVLNRSVVHDLA